MYNDYLKKIEIFFDYDFNDKELLRDIYENNYSHLDFYGNEILVGILNLNMVVDKNHLLNKLTSGERRNLRKYYTSSGYLAYLFRDVILSKDEYFGKKSTSLIDPYAEERTRILKCILTAMWIDSKEESHFFIFRIRHILNIETKNSVEYYKNLFSFSNPYFVLFQLVDKGLVHLSERIYKTSEIVVTFVVTGILFDFHKEASARGESDLDIRIDVATTILNDIEKTINLDDYL